MRLPVDTELRTPSTTRMAEALKMSGRRAAFAAALLVCACSGTPTAPPASEGPDQIFYGVQHSMVVDGVVRGRIAADSAFLFVPPGTVTLHSVGMDVLSPTVPQQGARLRAREARLELTRPVLLAIGDVEMTAAGSSRRLQAEQLEVDLGANAVRASGTSTIIVGDEVRSVEDFSGDLELHERPRD